MMVVRGNTANFVVAYDDSLANGPALADAVLLQCEPDLAAMSTLFGGLMPVAASLPFHVNLIPGGGGAGHPSCLATTITCFIYSGSDAIGVPKLVDAEVVEVLEATQALGFDCAASNGEALSRVMPGVLDPSVRFRFSVGNSWLNSTAPSRPDWVTNTEPTDTNLVSIGCGTLFLNYLADQLGFTWPQIIAAASPTLAGTAAELGLQNAFADFSTLLARHYPPGLPAYLQDDDPFPLPDPHLYLRHNLADTGKSHAPPLAKSPDIIVRNTVVATPQATFSTAASINSDTESDPNVFTGATSYVYLRVWNSGLDAPNVSVLAYWSPPATLVTPNLWNLIGGALFADVPAGSGVRVTDPGINWGSVPGPGHYCFVATVGNADDPAPEPSTFASFDDFVAYIAAHNNIAWRNFDVVMNTPKGLRHRFYDWVPLPFYLTGPWDERRHFTFETIARLPAGSRLALEVPVRLGLAFEGAGRMRRPRSDERPNRQLAAELTGPASRKRIRLTLDPRRGQSLGEIELPAGTKAASHLLVHIPPESRRQAYEVAVAQLYEGREVGRITWRLVPPPRRRRGDEDSR
jgi:hypothetical protein